MSINCEANSPYSKTELCVSFAPTKTIRELKGKSILNAIDDYVVVDIETTGLDPRFDEIIEIAALKITKGEIVEQFHCLVNPGREIDEFITELTGITNDKLHEQPNVQAVLPLFLDFVGSSVIIAHNANFDINFLYDNFLYYTDHHFTNDFVDTLRMSRRLFKDQPIHKLDVLAQVFSLKNLPTHRALDDCLCVHELYCFFKQFAADTGVTLSGFPEHYTTHAANIKPTKTEFDTSHPFYGAVCTITGKLQIPRKDAMQAIADLGGINADGLTKKTNYLILGDNSDCSTITDGKSTKQKKTEEYILKGQDITILTEQVFLDMLNED